MQLFPHNPVMFCNLTLLLRHQWLFQHNFLPNSMLCKKTYQQLKIYVLLKNALAPKKTKNLKLLVVSCKTDKKTKMNNLIDMSVIFICNANMILKGGFINKISSIFADILVTFLWILLFARETELTNLIVISLTFFCTVQLQLDELVLWLWYEPYKILQHLEQFFMKLKRRSYYYLNLSKNLSLFVIFEFF